MWKGLGHLRLRHVVLLSTHRGASQGWGIPTLKSQRTDGGEAVTTPLPGGASSKPNRCLLLWDATWTAGAHGHGLLRAKVQDDAGTPSATDKGAANLGPQPPPACLPLGASWSHRSVSCDCRPHEKTGASLVPPLPALSDG